MMNGPETQNSEVATSVEEDGAGVDVAGAAAASAAVDGTDGQAHAGGAGDDVDADVDDVSVADGDVDAAADEATLGDLDDHASVELDVTPEIAVADSLNQALRQLRDDADRIEQMPLDGARIDAAERLAEDAAAIDEEIGSIARSDEG